jgi:hypothetical protein
MASAGGPGAQASAGKATTKGRPDGGKTGKIFISYRREDADESAGRIRDWLIGFGHVPRQDIFMDVHSVQPGANFVQEVERTIALCRTMIVVIGPGWFVGHKTPSAYVHDEVRLALRHNLRVVPVLVRGVTMPKPDELPDDIRDLAFRNARKVRSDDDFEYDMQRLATALGVRLAAGASFLGLPSSAVAAIVSVLLLFAVSVAVLSQAPEGNPIYNAVHWPTSTATVLATATVLPTATIPPAPTARVMVHTSSQQVTESAGDTAVTASCASGEQLLSGGYTVETAGGAEPIMAEASYPSDINTWIATLAFYSNRTEQATLRVYAYCLKASFPIGVHIEQSPKPQLFTGDGSATTSAVTCPQGSTLTGGGYQVHWAFGGTPQQPASYVLASEPKSNGWSVTTESRSPAFGQIVFAVCATQNLTTSDPTMHRFIAPPSTSSEDSVNCPSSSQFITGGGFDMFAHGSFGTDLFFSNHATTDLTHWDIKVDVADTVQHLPDSWAVCVGLPQHV